MLLIINIQYRYWYLQLMLEKETNAEVHVSGFKGGHLCSQISVLICIIYINFDNHIHMCFDAMFYRGALHQLFLVLEWGKAVAIINSLNNYYLQTMQVVGLMYFAVMRAHECGQWMRSCRVNVLCCYEAHECGQWMRSCGANALCHYEGPWVWSVSEKLLG